MQSKCHLKRSRKTVIAVSGDIWRTVHFFIYIYIFLVCFLFVCFKAWALKYLIYVSLTSWIPCSVFLIYIYIFIVPMYFLLWSTWSSSWGPLCCLSYILLIITIINHCSISGMSQWSESIVWMEEEIHQM